MSTCKTHLQFIEDIKGRLLTPLSQYERSSRKVTFRCDVCQHVFSSIPNSILCGTGCPQCGKSKSIDSRRLTHAEVVERICGRHITILTEYAGARKRMTFRCDIDGTIWSTSADSVMRGCGCPTCGRKSSDTNRRQENKVIEDHGGWLLVDVSTRKTPEASMKIDAEDFERIRGDYKMFVSHGYVSANRREKNKGSVRIHRIILCLDESDKSNVDHINHDTTDNRKSNLRVVTQSQNLMNARIQKRNKSGCKHVHFAKREQKWLVRIHANGKPMFIGYFKELSDAIAARKAAEVKYYGEFAYNPAQDATLQPA